MKIRWTNWLTAVPVIVALISCGGGGGGSGGSSGGGGSGSLAAGGFVKSFSPAPAPGSSDSALFYSGSDAKVQYLYLASEIGGAGNITSLRFLRGGDVASMVSCPNTTIKIGHTNVTALGATFAANVQTGQGSLMTVFDNATLSIPAGVMDTWFDVPFTTPFQYNGRDNLVIEVSHWTGCDGTEALRFIDASSNRLAYTLMYPDPTPGTSDLGSAETTAAHTYTRQVLAQFVFSGGDNKVDFSATPSSDPAPLAAASAYKKIQMLYTAASISGSGPITGVGFQVASATTTPQSFTYTMKMGHTSLTDLTTTWNSNFNVGSPVTVANSATFTVPAGVPAGEFIWLPIPDGVFNYDGTDNLVIELSVASASGNIPLSTHITSNVSRVWGDPASTTASDVNYYTQQIALRFNGGSIVMMPTGTNWPDPYPFNPSGAYSSRKQNLYMMSELGTGGKITSIACRLDDAFSGTTTATNYTNFKVVLGHYPANSLSTTFSLNMNDATTVFNGTFALPAGLRAGDWIEIPLSTPFTYDPTQNLVVDISGDSSTTNYNCSAKANFPLYSNRHLKANSLTATTGTSDSIESALKLTISK